MAGQQQRDVVSGPGLAPPWLCGYNSNGQKFLYIFGLMLDMLLEKSNEAQIAKCPGQGADQSAIPLQAADRVLVQGPAESNASFTLRLENAFNSWARAGSRPSALAQLQAYMTDLQVGVAASLPECLIVGGNTSLTTWDSLTIGAEQNAPPAHALISPANWNWDGLNLPARAWLVLFMHLVSTGQSGASAAVASTGGSGVAGVTTGFATLTGLAGIATDNVQQYITLSGGVAGNTGTFQITSVVSTTSVIIANTAAVVTAGPLAWTIGQYPYIGPAPVWGSPDFVWGDGTWGVNCSELVIQSVRSILKTWKAASTYYPNIIISFGGGDATAGNEFSPNSAEGAGNPDGSWVYPGTGKPLNPFTAICDGTGLATSCYEKWIT